MAANIEKDRAAAEWNYHMEFRNDLAAKAEAAAAVVEKLKNLKAQYKKTEQKVAEAWEAREAVCRAANSKDLEFCFKEDGPLGISFSSFGGLMGVDGKFVEKGREETIISNVLSGTPAFKFKGLDAKVGLELKKINGETIEGKPHREVMDNIIKYAGRPLTLGFTSDSDVAKTVAATQVAEAADDEAAAAPTAHDAAASAHGAAPPTVPPVAPPTVPPVTPPPES